MMFTPQLEMQPLAPGAAVPTSSIKISHGWRFFDMLTRSSCDRSWDGTELQRSTALSPNITASIKRARIERRQRDPRSRWFRTRDLRSTDGSINRCRHRRCPSTQADSSTGLESSTACPAPCLGIISLDLGDSNSAMSGCNCSAKISWGDLVDEASSVSVLLGG
jgi:hypothetical protein